MTSQVAHFSRAIQNHSWLKLLLVVITAAGVALLPAGSYDASVAAIVALSGVLAISLLLLRARDADREFLLRLFVLGFGVRALLAAFLHFSGVFREMDSKSYTAGGWVIAQTWRGIIEPSLIDPSLSGEFYYEVNAFIFNAIGYSPLSVKIINCFFGVLTGIFVYFIAKYRFGKTAAVISSLLSAFWPSLVFWSTQNLKEPSTLFFTCVLIWAVLQLHHRISWKYILIILVSSLYTYCIRRNHLGLLLFAVLSSFLFGFKSSRRKILVLSTFALLAGMFLYHSNFVPDLLSVISPESIIYRNRAAWGGGALPLVEPSIKGLLSLLPKGVIYFLLGPFPWDSGSFLQAMTIPEMLLWYSLLPFTLYGMVCAIKERDSEAYLILAYVTPMILADAILLGNLGQMYRHRYLVWPLLFIFTGAGLQRFLAKVRSKSILGRSEGDHEHESCI